MSNLKTVEYLTSIIMLAQDTDSWDDMEKCAEVARNAALYALSLPEDEREAFADALAGIEEGGSHGLDESS